MKFCWCTVTVADLERSLAFYQDIVGLTVSRRFMAGPSKEIVFLGDGETKVELVYNAENEGVPMGEGISLGFEVDSVSEKIGFIQDKGLQVESGPFQPNPHIQFFYVKDPDGVKIQFVENL